MNHLSFPPSQSGLGNTFSTNCQNLLGLGYISSRPVHSFNTASLSSRPPHSLHRPRHRHQGAQHATAALSNSLTTIVSYNRILVRRSFLAQSRSVSVLFSCRRPNHTAYNEPSSIEVKRASVNSQTPAAQLGPTHWMGNSKLDQ